METEHDDRNFRIASSNPSTQRRGLCLIVDDSATIRRVMAGMIQKLGYEVAQAPTGAQAVAYCRDQVPDLIFLDWNMPVMDGITCLRALRAMPLTPRPTIILCTSEHTLPKIHEALDSGADEYIMKPFDADIVHDKLAQLGLAEAGIV